MNHGSLTRRTRYALLALFFGLSSFYLLTMSGHPYAHDEDTLFSITAGLVERHELAISPEVPLPNVLPGKDGRLYSQSPPGQSVAAIPLYLVGRIMASFAPTAIRPFVTQMYVHTFNVWVTALLCVLVAATAQLFGAPLRGALVLALLLGVTTMQWVYARTFSTEPLTALLTLLSFYSITRGAQGNSTRWLALSGFSAGLALLASPHAVLAWLPLGLYLVLMLGWSDQRWHWPHRFWYKDRGARVLRGIVLWLAGLVPSLTLTVTYTFIVFNDVLPPAYSLNAGSTSHVPWHIGLYSLTISSSRGIVLYAPLVIVAVAALWEFGRRYRWAALSICVALITHLLVFCWLYHWYGGGSWGPRSFLLILPLLVLPLASWLRRGRLRRALIGLLGVVGFAVTLIGVWTNFDTSLGAAPDQAHFSTPPASPITQRVAIAGERWGQWQNIFFPKRDTVTLVEGYSYEGIERPGPILPVKAQPFVVLFVRPQEPGEIVMSLTAEDSTTIDLVWDGTLVSEKIELFAVDGTQRIQARLPGERQTHQLQLHITPAKEARVSLSSVSELQLRQNERALRLVTRPFIPAMPEALSERRQWFYLPSIPHLCDLWLWYLYVAGVGNRAAVLVALPILGLGLVLALASVVCARIVARAQA